MIPASARTCGSPNTFDRVTHAIPSYYFLYLADNGIVHSAVCRLRENEQDSNHCRTSFEEKPLNMN